MKTTTLNQKMAQLEYLLASTLQLLSETVNAFDEDNFNIVPFEESWTAAQTSEHVLKSLELINQAVKAPAQSTARNPEQYLTELQAMMENLEAKAKSAPELLPGDEPMSITTIDKRILKCEEQMIQCIQNLDLMETCTTIKFLGIGYLTRYEFISFSAFHTKRHIHQINNINKAVTNI